MKVSLQGMLATTAAAAALFAGAQVARADGMPAGPSYARPALWSGFYAGIESGWDWDQAKAEGPAPLFTGSAHWNRDVINAGLFVGYQHQFGNLVLGVEANLIGNQFDNADSNHDVTPLPGKGNCPNTNENCVQRITNLFTVGPRVGWALGNFMPYATGGFASGSINFRAIDPTGVAQEWADSRSNGWFAGGGLDWKLARNVVVGIEYRHTDLGWANVETFNNAGVAVEGIRQRADSDAVLLRGSLLFGQRDYAPLK